MWDLLETILASLLLSLENVTEGHHKNACSQVHYPVSEHNITLPHFFLAPFIFLL